MAAEIRVGRSLATLRERSGLKREELAVRAGVDAVRIADIEQGLEAATGEVTTALVSAMAIALAEQGHQNAQSEASAPRDEWHELPGTG